MKKSLSLPIMIFLVMEESHTVICLKELIKNHQQELYGATCGVIFGLWIAKILNHSLKIQFSECYTYLKRIKDLTEKEKVELNKKIEEAFNKHISNATDLSATDMFETDMFEKVLIIITLLKKIKFQSKLPQ